MSRTGVSAVAEITALVITSRAFIAAAVARKADPATIWAKMANKGRRAHAPRPPVHARRSGFTLRLRGRRSAERRQALEINGDRLTVGLGQFGEVADNGVHAAAKDVAGGREAAGQRLDDVGVGPGQEAAASEVRRLAVTVRQRGARERLAFLHLAQKSARRVTFAAMAGALDEIAAAVPLFALARVGAKRCVVEVEQLPQAHGAANGKRKGERVRRRLPLDRRQRVQERGEIGDVLRS